MGALGELIPSVKELAWCDSRLLLLMKRRYQSRAHQGHRLVEKTLAADRR